MIEDIKRLIILAWFMGPWTAIIYWIVLYDPPVMYWLPICIVWSVIWIVGGNQLTVKLFPGVWPEYEKKHRRPKRK